jgi:addiction module HigA family antidote
MGSDSNFAFEPSHPGEFLREDVLPELEARGITKNAFADHLKISGQTLQDVLNGNQAVTTDLACRLGRALGNGTRFWLTLQMQYDIWKAEQAGCDVSPLDIKYAS